MNRPNNIKTPSLFDCYNRTNRSGGRRAETAFEFFNRSAWRSAEIARDTFESWFANLPHGKRADLRARFRGDDRSHSASLLELATHEILRATAENVRVEPDLGGGRPDFSAVYRGTEFIVECRVAQESDAEFGALQRENAVTDAINSIQAGPFRLMLEPISVGGGTPPLSRLRNHLEGWLTSLPRVGESAPRRNGLIGESTVWQWQDWLLRFEAIPIHSPTNGDAIGVTTKPVQAVTDNVIIGRALKKKAERYRPPQVPYLIVVARRESLAGAEIILDALLGPMSMVFGPNGSIQTRTFDGLWGSPSNPRSRHVSAVLYKHRMRDAWSICSQTSATDYFDDT
jgi:hypothetical protein